MEVGRNIVATTNAGPVIYETGFVPAEIDELHLSQTGLYLFHWHEPCLTNQIENNLTLRALRCTASLFSFYVHCPVFGGLLVTY